MFEVGHVVADLAGVNGAVLMSDCFEILGFGVEIAGELPESQVAPYDLDATRKSSVRTDRVGTRHRSAYRLYQAVPDPLALVVSQDGGFRFIRWQDDIVAYQEQVATELTAAVAGSPAPNSGSHVACRRATRLLVTSPDAATPSLDLIESWAL